MNFYEYYQPGEDIKDPIYQAARLLIDLNFNVLPIAKGLKIPPKGVRSNILRLQPIHEKNMDFYWKDDAHDLALITGGNLEVVDIDLKYDLTGNIYKALMTAIKVTLPDVYDKLVIQRTRGKGYHLFYKCDQVGSSKALAQRYATRDELEKGDRVKVLIETRGNGGHIMISPSPGYEFIKGNPADIQMITPDERFILLGICMSFNQVDLVEFKGISKYLLKKDDTPWKVFNTTHDWGWIQQQLVERGWTVSRESHERVYMLRPGESQQRSSGSIYKPTSVLYLFTTSSEFEANVPYSPFGVKTQLNYDGDWKAASKDLAALGTGTWNAEDGEFYNITEKGAVNVKYIQILDWLKDIGIRKFFRADNEYDWVQVLDNRVKIITIETVKKIFIDYISTNSPEKVINYFMGAVGKIFSEGGFIQAVDPIHDHEFIKSTYGDAYLFFQNCVVKVNRAQVLSMDYNKMTSYVWEKNIIKRDFTLADDKGSDVGEFIRIVAGERPAWVQSFRSAIGFLLHAYKDPANPKAVILNDEFMDEEREAEPEGGTGKGMFIQLIQHFRNTYAVDGKTFNFEKSFLYQGLNYDTEVFAIEDARKNFDFERLFSIITEGWTVEKKGLQSFVIPYERSPKVLITTNYAIKGSSSSHLRRRYELELAPFFSHKYTILQHFGHRFFSDWSKDEWLKFDNYMVQCLQFYMENGFETPKNVNLDKKKLISETSGDFIQWISGLYNTKKLIPVVTKVDFMKKFTDLYPDYVNGKYKLTQTKFTQWVVRWAEFVNVKVDTRSTLNGVMAYRFNLNEAVNDVPDSEIQGSDSGNSDSDSVNQTEMPF